MRQYLIIDADDTLWENNIYFEQAFEDFCDFLDHSTLTQPQIRGILDEIELVNAKINGYGSRNFGANLQQCYQRLAEREIRAGDLDTVLGFALRILEQPLEIIPGVEETLEYLAAKHLLILFTKGHAEEQKLKIDRSGLGAWFEHTVIVKEKDVPSYRTLTEEHGLPRERTWMIGNSPKSDINPALRAGLNAVFVPHARTWTLERQELSSPPESSRLVVVDKFSDLRDLF